MEKTMNQKFNIIFVIIAILICSCSFKARTNKQIKEQLIENCSKTSNCHYKSHKILNVERDSITVEHIYYIEYKDTVVIR